MCGILATTKVGEFQRCLELNTTRGVKGYSFWQVGKNAVKLNEQPYSAPQMYSFVPSETAWLNIYHFVTPTGGLNYHPAIAPSQKLPPSQVCGKPPCYLWHNGILKTPYTRKLMEKHGLPSTWDTLLLCHEISTCLDDIETCLSSVDGTFACLLFVQDLGLFAFRTSTCPLQYNDYALASKVPDGKDLPHSTLFSLENNAGKIKFDEIGKFNPVSSPYFGI